MYFIMDGHSQKQKQNKNWSNILQKNLPCKLLKPFLTKSLASFGGRPRLCSFPPAIRFRVGSKMLRARLNTCCWRGFCHGFGRSLPGLPIPRLSEVTCNWFFHGDRIWCWQQQWTECNWDQSALISNAFYDGSVTCPESGDLFYWFKLTGLIKSAST